MKPPNGSIQCPVQRPFSKYGADKTVTECCKCQGQTQCEAAAAGTNYYNWGGAKAMMEKNDVVDKSKLTRIKQEINYDEADDS